MKIFVKKSKNEVCYIRAWREEEQAEGATADERFHLKSSGEGVVDVIPRFRVNKKLFFPLYLFQIIYSFFSNSWNFEGLL